MSGDGQGEGAEVGRGGSVSLTEHGRAEHLPSREGRCQAGREEQCQTEQQASLAGHQPGHDRNSQDARRCQGDTAEHPRADNNTHLIRQSTTKPVAVARQVKVPIVTIRGPTLKFTTQDQRCQAEQRSRDQAEQSGSMPTEQQNPNMPDEEQAAGCAQRWSQVLDLWRESDQRIEEMITQAKGETPAWHKKEGEDTKRLEQRWEEMSRTDHECEEEICKEEDKQLLEITRRNLAKIKNQEARDQEDRVDNGRNDEEFMEWKGWHEREEMKRKEKEERLQAKKRKEDGWALVKECTAILEENKTIWKERREWEKRERLEQEKDERLEMAKRKKEDYRKTRTVSHKVTRGGKKEVKAKLESRKRLEGISLMKSNMWKQRREKDGRLVTVCKEIKRKMTEEEGIKEDQPQGRQETSQEEDQETSLQINEDMEDNWLAELLLTEDDRRKLKEMEDWWEKAKMKEENHELQKEPPEGSAPKTKLNRTTTTQAATSAVPGRWMPEIGSMEGQSGPTTNSPNPVVPSGWMPGQTVQLGGGSAPGIEIPGRCRPELNRTGAKQDQAGW